MYLVFPIASCDVTRVLVFNHTWDDGIFLLALYLSLPTFHFRSRKNTSIALNADDVRWPTGFTVETKGYSRKIPRQKMKLLVARSE